MLRKGRFGKDMDPDASKYTSSIKDDRRIFEAVVQINIAHTAMLREQEIIDKSDGKKILQALSNLQKKGIEALDLHSEMEDIHMAIEGYMSKEVGEETGGKLHTAKSRNDQVSTAIRMVLRKEILKVQEALVSLIDCLTNLASENLETIMPGYTHLQIAQPTTFAHHLSSYGQALFRDLERLDGAYEVTNVCPMGACALAGTSFPIDRTMIKKLLGFNKVTKNSIDAVGSRDFALQAMSNLAIMMSNLSRLAEEIILWSSTEFDLIEISESFASTSSIMPQKKNPVVAELIRAKSAEVIGELMGGLSLVKSLPQSYNLDLQELTPILWRAIDQSKSSLKIMKKLIKNVKPKPERMRELAKKGFSTVTELADVIVREGEVPFRTSHAIVGKMVSNAIKNKKELDDLSLEDLQSASLEVTGIEVDISETQLKEALNLEKFVKSRSQVGDPKPETVKGELKKLEDKTKARKDATQKRMKGLAKAKEKLWGLAEKTTTK